MFRYLPWRAAWLAIVAAAHPAPAAAQPCLLCEPASPAVRGAPDAAVPLRIEITAGLDFSRVATGMAGGTVVLDPASGSRHLSGGLIDLGGFALTGEAVVRGAPGRTVRIILPGEILLVSDTGRTARATGLVTDIGMIGRLGADGMLRFRFGARLAVGGDDDGNYRGRVPIGVEYE